MRNVALTIVDFVPNGSGKAMRVSAREGKKNRRWKKKDVLSHMASCLVQNWKKYWCLGYGKIQGEKQQSTSESCLSVTWLFSRAFECIVDGLVFRL
jgi:hypothetical protein